MSEATASTPFAESLRRHRIAAGLTQEELAERAGLSPRGLVYLERGTRRPYRDTMRRLAEALGLAGDDRAVFLTASRGLSSGGDAGETAVESPAWLEEARVDTPLPRGRYLGALPDNQLVGREAELDRMLAALHTARAGQGGLVLLAGEPGIGKTRLAQELMVRAGEHGIRLLAGRCYEQSTALPFFPFIEAMSTALAAASSTLRRAAPHRFSYLGCLLPDLIERPPVREGEDVRVRIWYAVGGFLAALAAESPVVLFLDDLHWADSASLEVLLHLARRARGDAILLVGTYRDVEVNRRHPLEAALGELVRERLVEEVNLRGLSAAGTAALIGAHVGREAPAGELCDLLHARTEGNPFFLEEVLKALMEQQAIFPSGEGWDRTAIGTIDVPRSVRSVVGRRVGRLPPEAQEMLRVASVLGQEWDLDLLLAVAGAEEEAVLRHVEAALEMKLLEERRVGRRERYGFVHALIGQALYEEVPRFRLRRLHLRAGEALERAYEERPEAWAELARHFLAAGEEQRATRYSLLAGDHAAELYAHAEAVRQYEAAVALLEEARDEPGLAWVRTKLGTALRAIGHYDTALTVLDQAAETYGATGDLEGLARVTAQIGWVHTSRGTGGEGIARTQPVLDLIELRGPVSGLAELHFVFTYLLFFSGRYSELRVTSDRLVDLARTMGDNRILAKALITRSNVLLKAGPLEMVGRVTEAHRLNEEATHLAEVVGDLEILVSALVLVAYSSAIRGEFGSTGRYYERAIAVADRLSDPFSIIFTAAMHGWITLLMGEWDQARGECGRAVAMARQASMPWAASYALLHRGQLCLAEGKWVEASSHLEEACAHARRGDDIQALRQAVALLAELEILERRPEAAHAHLVPLLDRPGLEEYDVTALLPVLAWAHLELGELARASDILSTSAEISLG